MKFFVRFAFVYLALVCVLTWFRDDPIATTSILIVALIGWAIKRGWVAKFIRASDRQFKSTMKTQSKNDRRDDSRELVSRWNKFIDSARIRPLHFYSVLEEKLAQRRIPKIRCSRVCLRETGPLSAKREYLKIRRKDLEFYICGAPFGTGFFVSSRIIKQNGLTFTQKIIAVFAYLLAVVTLIKAFGLAGVALLIVMAIVGAVYIALTSNPTCYETDLTETFRHAVHNSVLEAIDELTTIRPINTPPARPSVPLMAELFS